MAMGQAYLKGPSSSAKCHELGTACNTMCLKGDLKPDNTALSLNSKVIPWEAWPYFCPAFHSLSYRYSATVSPCLPAFLLFPIPLTLGLQPP